MGNFSQRTRRALESFYRNLRYTIIYLFLHVAFTNAVGQIQPMRIGEKAPEIKFSISTPNKGKRIVKLSDFKGKLVILDFWATWCMTCIAKMPKIDSLQHSFKKDVLFILVNSYVKTGDSDSRAFATISLVEKKMGKPLKILSALNDSTAAYLFPHGTVPHYVWISPEGKFLGTSGFEDVTSNNLKQYIENRSISFISKKDQEFINNRPLGYLDLIDLDSLDGYSYFKKGKLDGLTKISKKRIYPIRPGAYNTRGYAMRNVRLKEIYETVFKLKNQGSLKSRNYFAIEVTDSFELVALPTNIDERSVPDSLLYTYDMVVPLKEYKLLPQLMLDDLNKYTDYFAQFEKKKVKCYVLASVDQSRIVLSKGGSARILSDSSGQVKFRNVNMESIVRSLDDLFQFINYPVLNETEYSGYVDLILSNEVKDMNSLRRELLLYGLDLKESEKELEMLVIKDKSKKNQLK